MPSMKIPARVYVQEKNGKRFGISEYLEEVNWEHVANINDGNVQGVPAMITFIDNREISELQRHFYYALLGDIINWSGEDKEVIDEYFHNLYWEKNCGEEISLKDGSANSMSDAKKLIDYVIDFIFDNQVPVKKGYELLPRNEEHFQYECLMHKQCLVCGQHADFHHIDTVGMGNNRNEIDHTKHRVMALCRVHHTEFHKIGITEFCKKYHLTTVGIKLSEKDLKKLKVIGNYEEEINNAPF